MCLIAKWRNKSYRILTPSAPCVFSALLYFSRKPRDYQMPSTNPAYHKVVTSSETETPYFLGAESTDSQSDRLLQQQYHQVESNSSTMMDSEVVPGRNIPSTHSSEELIAGASSSDSEEGRKQSIVPEATTINRSNHRIEMFTVFVLCFVNLINYMDRFTIAGEWTRQ